MRLKALDASYQRRAVPAGSARYWSWLFAAPPMRAPLLGIYALLAEWHALAHPAIEHGVAHLKLGWWREEIERLGQGTAVHPISIYLLALPGADRVDFSALAAAVAAVAAEVSGSPVERGADLGPHAGALWGGPLAVAAQYLEGPSIDASVQAYATGRYLARAITDYVYEQRFGRVPFAIDELLAAGIEDEDLALPQASVPLAAYLERLRARSAGYFDAAASALPAAARLQQRHILILVALGARRLREQGRSRQSRRWQDMLLAWRTARGSQASTTDR